MKKIPGFSILGAAMFAGLPAAANAPELDMLSSLSAGQYELRFRDGQPARRICVRSGRELLQIGHPGLRCNSFVVADGASEVDVNYTCPGQGYGRTLVRKETSSLVQIDTQGIRGGMPYAWNIEARRTGACR